MRNKTTGIVSLALGLVLCVAGIVDHAFAAPRAALCQPPPPADRSWWPQS